MTRRDAGSPVAVDPDLRGPREREADVRTLEGGAGEGRRSCPRDSFLPDGTKPGKLL